jgi:hypothetical protein
MCLYKLLDSSGSASEPRRSGNRAGVKKMYGPHPKSRFTPIKVPNRTNAPCVCMNVYVCVCMCVCVRVCVCVCVCVCCVCVCVF